MSKLVVRKIANGRQKASADGVSKIF